MFELILSKCQQDPDPVSKILICWIRIRPKMDRIRNPGLDLVRLSIKTIKISKRRQVYHNYVRQDLILDKRLEFLFRISSLFLLEYQCSQRFLAYLLNNFSKSFSKEVTTAPTVPTYSTYLQNQRAMNNTTATFSILSVILKGQGHEI